MSPSELAAAAAFPLEAVELATGLVFGVVEDAPPLPTVAEAATIRSEMEDVIRAAFRRGPVAVSFSGGRDSSTVLAVAHHVARKEGFEPPLPVTLLYPGIEAADESSWQDLVLSHLGIEERLVIEVSDELDLLGPVATSVMRRHGLLWPPNGFSHDHMLRQCPGFTMLTGGGGDELFDDSAASRTQLLLAGRVRPSLRDLARVSAAMILPSLYNARRSRYQPRLAWLTMEGQTLFARKHVRDLGPPYRSWRRRMWDHANARAFVALRRGQELLAAARQARIVHPFLEPSVVAAAAHVGGRLGLGGRTNAMRAIAADLLPDALLSRQTKASFSEGFWAKESLKFARSQEALDAIAADPSLCDLVAVDWLRAEWAKPQPHFLTAVLLQSSYMSTRMQRTNDQLQWREAKRPG